MSDKTVANEALHEESAEARRRVLELEGVARDGTAQTGQRMPDKWEACRENEARFRSLVETTSDWLWEVDAQCIYTYASPKLTDLLGYAPEEVLGKKPFDLMPADEARRVESLMASIFSAARAFSNLENLNRHKNGRLVYLETSGIPILDETGGLLGYRGIDRDISDRKRAMEVLRESEENYRILFETMAQGVVYQDAQGRIISANPAAERILGLTLAEMTGRTSHDPRWRCVHEDGSDFHGDQHPSMVALRTGRPVSDVVMGVFHPLEQRHRWIVIQAVPLFKPGETGSTKVYTSFTDITDRRYTEQALKDECRFRQGLLQCAAEGLCVCHEARDFPHLVFTVWNARMTEITGYTMEEINRLGWYQSLYPDPQCQAKVIARMDAMRQGDDLRNEECEITRSDGIKRVVSMSTSVVARRPGEVHVLTLMQDVTERTQADQERVKLQAQVQQAQKLESLGVLAGGIAHDFNNLLTAILGHASLALLDLPPDSSARLDLREIEKVSHCAADLCKQMLAYAGMGRFVVEPLDLSRLVQELSHLLRVSISKKALLRCDFDENLPVIEADPAQLRQVIMNLVINASEAIGDNEGVIVIATGSRQCDEGYLHSALLDPLPSGEYVYVEVADTGCGMDAATQAKIFDPFFTTKFAGRGLGLAAVLGIVRAHNGTVKVESVPGKGSTIRILFPASPGVTHRSEGDEAGALWQGHGTILVVDDEKPVRTVAKTILERCGFRVVTAANGRQAVRIFKRHSNEISCVLLDLLMPHMDGEETFKEMRRVRGDVPVIVASGYSEQEVTRRFAGQQPAGFIEKPYAAFSLSYKLREVLTQGPE